MAFGLASIQEVVVANAAIANQTQVDVTVDTTDWTKSWIMGSRRTDVASNAEYSYWTWVPLDSTHIRLNRATTYADTLGEMRFWILRGGTGVSVEHFTGTSLTEGTAQDHTLTLGGTQATQFWVPCGFRDAGTGGRSVDHSIRYRMTTDSNVRATIYNNAGAEACDAYAFSVVRIDDASVQHDVQTVTGASNSFTEAITSVTMSQTFLICSGDYEPGIDNENLFGQVYLNSATQIAGNRDNGNSLECRLAFQTISIPTITVDRGNFSITNGFYSTTATIPDRPLDFRTIHLVTATYPSQLSQSYAQKRPRQCLHTCEFNSTTQAQFEKASNSAQGLVLGSYEAVSWPQAEAGGGLGNFAGALPGI